MTAPEAAMGTTDTDRARQHITVLAEEAHKAITPGATDGGSLFMSGVINGLAMARQILDGDTAEQALTAMETSMATVIGRLFLTGRFEAAPAPEPEPTNEG